MAHYKIKNITGKLPKRHVNKDTVLKIEYHVGFLKKFRSLNVGDELLLTCRTLPVSVQNLRAKQLVIISQISANEFVKLQKPSARRKPPVEKKEAPKKEAPKKEVKEVKASITTTVKPPKKSTRKKVETDETVIIKEEK